MRGRVEQQMCLAVGTDTTLHTVAASMACGCSLHDLWLQVGADSGQEEPLQEAGRPARRRGAGIGVGIGVGIG
eukprot:scaffold93045_cov53-Phaeocystis_antarctica.AAC.1